MKHLYMFALMPPAALSAEIHKERLIFAEKYNAYKALKPPVHLTLYPPFSEDADFGDKAEVLRSWIAEQDHVAVELSGYNYFSNRRSPVIFIDIVDNSALDSLYHKFIEQLAQLMPIEESETYKPHFTLGYRDVPRSLFSEIKEHYSRRVFHASFEVRSIFLWIHDREKWNIHKEFELRSS